MAFTLICVKNGTRWLDCSQQSAVQHRFNNEEALMRYKAKSVAVLQLALVVCQIECEVRRNNTSEYLQIPPVNFSWRRHTHMATSIGSRIEGSSLSFSGLLTRVDIDHMRIGSSISATISLASIVILRRCPTGNQFAACQFCKHSFVSERDPALGECSGDNRQSICIVHVR